MTKPIKMKKLKATYRLACRTDKEGKYRDGSDWSGKADSAWAAWKTHLHGTATMSGGWFIAVEAKEFEDGSIEIE